MIPRKGKERKHFSLSRRIGGRADSKLTTEMKENKNGKG
jgi:hypothetical protein